MRGVLSIRDGCLPRWSAWVWQGGEALPACLEGACPGSGRLDLQDASAGVRDQAGRDVPDHCPKRLGLGRGEFGVVLATEELEVGKQVGGEDAGTVGLGYSRPSTMSSATASAVNVLTHLLQSCPHPHETRCLYPRGSRHRDGIPSRPLRVLRRSSVKTDGSPILAVYGPESKLCPNPRSADGNRFHLDVCGDTGATHEGVVACGT